MAEREIPDTVTRVVVVTGNQGAHEFFGDTWGVSIQDDGQTLKLFKQGRGAQARMERDEALARDVAEDRYGRR